MSQTLGQGSYICPSHLRKANPNIHVSMTGPAMRRVGFWPLLFSLGIRKMSLAEHFTNMTPATEPAKFWTIETLLTGTGSAGAKIVGHCAYPCVKRFDIDCPLDTSQTLVSTRYIHMTMIWIVVRYRIEKPSLTENPWI